MCHPERGRRATESNFCGSNISRQSREIKQAKAQVLADASRSGICDGFAQRLLDQRNIFYLPQPLVYRTVEDVGPYKKIIKLLPDPQSAIIALCLSKISNSLQIFESSTRKHPHRGVCLLRMTHKGEAQPKYLCVGEAEFACKYASCTR